LCRKLIAKRRLPSVEHPYQAPLRKGRQGIDGATGTDPLSEYRALKNATYNGWIDAELARVEIQRHKWVHSKAN
jgi:hypothetical protein